MRCPLILPVILLTAAPLALAAEGKFGPEYDDPDKAAAADPDFKLQGEYEGMIGAGDESKKVAVQVIALGGGKFEATGYSGGLPGDGWDGERNPRVQGERSGDAVSFGHENVAARITAGTLELYVNDNKVAELAKTSRESPTLGAKPPAGAVVLFDGKTNDFKGSKVTPDGLLMQGVTSQRTFGDCTVHIEFRLPYMPQARGQQRGNSGVYLMGRYEVQMLDSFGLDGLDNECGGLYRIAAPQVNMCFPPLTWQTYDIDVTAPRFDGAGRKIAPARLTVRHNGVVIHKDQPIPGPTTAAPIATEGPTGPIHLQDHGNPVRYRNIWVVENK